MDSILQFAKKFIPKKLFKMAQPVYHYALAFLAACIYRFPSRKIRVVMITGTKGKTTTAEMVNAALEAGGFKTALAGTLRFKVGNKNRPNLYKMTMPGRFFVQKFLREAVRAKCDWAILEMTSEAAVQFRHKFIGMDALIFLNLSPEHIESHGGYDNYVDAKVSLARALASSLKTRKTLVVNGDDKESPKFIDVVKSCDILIRSFSLRDISSHKTSAEGVSFSYKGTHFTSSLPGIFTIQNMLAAIEFVEAEGVALAAAERGLANLKEIGGRLQKINAGQNFTVVVDYAHTADSLEKLYGAFGDSRKICVIGNTGGGRDTWKRPEMAKVADIYCEHIILTNEDPYDEDPQKIINDMLPGIKHKPHEVIMDRRKAIARSLSLAHPGDTVIVSGKGTDPYIMEAHGKKTPWSDANIAREELEKMLAK